MAPSVVVASQNQFRRYSCLIRCLPLHEEASGSDGSST